MATGFQAPQALISLAECRLAFHIKTTLICFSIFLRGFPFACLTSSNLNPQAA